MADERQEDAGGEARQGWLPVAGEGEDVCPRCEGSGRLDGQACPECGGDGRITVKIAGG